MILSTNNFIFLNLVTIYWFEKIILAYRQNITIFLCKNITRRIIYESPSWEIFSVACSYGIINNK